MKQLSKTEERLLSLIKEERALREKKFTELVTNFTNWISVTVKNSLQYEVQSTLIKSIEDEIRENPYKDNYFIESTKLIRVPECYKGMFNSALYDQIGKNKVEQTFNLVFTEICENSGTVCESPKLVTMCEELNFKIVMRLEINNIEGEIDEPDDDEDTMIEGEITDPYTSTETTTTNQYAMAN